MKPDFIIKTILGLLLLLPGGVICAGTYLLPAMNTLEMSRTDTDILRDEARDVGSANFDRLREDEAFQFASGFTARLTLVRVLIVATVPAIIGVLIGLQGRAGRYFNWLLLTLIAVFLSPMVFAILVRIFLGPTWDFDNFDDPPLGELPGSLMLVNRNGARNVVNLTDAVLTLGVAMVVGGIAFAAVMRGRQTGQTPIAALVGVWFIGMLLAIASSAKTFTLPYMMTNGGPGFSSTTIPFLVYRYAFQNFRFGQAAAAVSSLLLLTIVAGIFLWAVISFLRLRIIFTPPPETKTSNVWSLASLPVILLLGLPVLGLIGWGYWLVTSNDGFEAGRKLLDLENTFINSILIPWLTIWIVQIPLAYLVGFSLGFLRPFGRWGANLLFLPFVVFTLMPAEILFMKWYEIARDQDIVNTSAALSLEWQMGFISLLIFKWFFDGAYEKYQAARQAGRTTGEAFVFFVFLPSIAIALLVGMVLSFLAVQSFLWPLITIIQRDEMPMTVRLALVQRGNALNFEGVAGAAMLFAGITAAIFLPVFALLQIFVVDRLAIVAGPPKEATPAVETDVTPDSLGLVVEAQ